MKEFDIVIIGGGPGGYVAAIRGAQEGASVALIEKRKLGGTCLNWGCIPTKALYHSAKALSAAKGAEEYGVELGGAKVGFNLSKAVERKNGIVDKLVGGVAQLLKGNGVEVFNGSAFIYNSARVTITRHDETEIIASRNIIIATGSEPAMIPAFNIDRKDILTSTEMLDMKEVPESLLIIGGGVMGCEFATIFAKFGAKVTIVELLDTILSTEDKQVVRTVSKSFKALGIDVKTGVTVESVEAGEFDGGNVKTTLAGGEELITTKALVSIGRSFNSAGLGLEELGVELDRGSIKVNERMETSVEGVYAIGDVVGGMLLAHVASTEGAVAVKNALGGDAVMDYSVIPAGIFTDPEIASVGLREKEAKEKGIEVSVGRFPYAASGKALGMGESEGFVQVVADPKTDKVLGASIVGAHATDLIGELALAMKTGASVKDIADTVHAHPTLPEIVQEAVEDIHGKAIHKISRQTKKRK
ncbi:MAG: dihydrolipoyl dehydrogenase [Proteobacteria bacterium]|nr:dihydrolipoyl dehydrogenase [Pseudomonadota bacterium]